VLKKIHHGNDRFVNPFSSVDFRNPWRMIRWKLFSENRFRV